MTEHDAAKYWSEVAAHMGARARGAEIAGDDAPYYRYKRDLFLKRFLSALPVEERSVLEIGCGPGGNLRQLARRGPARIVGCDIAPGMVQLARDAVAGLGVQVQLSDGAALPFSDREFDIVFTVTVLMHNPDRLVARLAAEMARVTDSSIYLIEDTTSTPDADWRGRTMGYDNFFHASRMP